ncbi:hypothetical protein IAQ61_006751 [Plenodomus lingam]|uniref:uncharacterized protein n=1 Tax=Leptosphaeria maculans TaxID=5022 RepID=UPI0033289122|nr:hypothetical protein IAQ61_006751 [Plenodomus lingam]
MAHVRTSMLTWQNSGTSDVTTTMEKLPVSRFLNPDLAAMDRALKWELISNSPGLSRNDFELLVSVHDVNHRSPSSAFTSEQLCISKDVESTLGSGECNACSVL